MNFGSPIKHNIEDLASVDWSLPEDHPRTAHVLSSQHHDTNIYTGCGKYDRDEWVGNVYPEGTKKKEYLEAYIKAFNSVELNSTFYSAKKAGFIKWAEAGKGNEFKFCPKWPRKVSFWGLDKHDDYVQYFVEMCLTLEDNLGDTFLQLPENFKPTRLEQLQAFLDKIPAGFPLHLEFRHADWFIEPYFSESFDYFESKGIGVVITDVAGRRDVLHRRLTTKSAFIRFNGYGMEVTTKKRIEYWAERIKVWRSQGLESAYFFGHQMDEIYTPDTCQYFLDKMN